MSTMLAQSVTVRFTARSTNGQYHPFESVRVENETQGWSQLIDYPDTVIVLGSSESIDVAEAIKGPQIKVYPNPFAGRTSTELQICEDGEATVSIMRINGSVVSEYNGFLKAGIYRLNVSLAEPQVAFLCVSTRSGRTVAKMVNTATGTADKIDISYLEVYSSQTKAVGIGPFNVGDQMSYNANYTSSNGITTSNTVTKSQTTSELITLFFTESSSTTLPTVTTSAVSNTTSSTATCGGNVTNDGNATVTARGVCWSTSHNPTVSNSHTTDGSGTGSFTSSITGLSQNTTYYVRAYATNSVGTAYGEERTFTTSASVSLPTVTTSSVSSITSSTATCGGNVTNDGNATVTARGVCWSTSHNPTVSNSHTTDGSGTGSFTSSITGLSANTTYYVRAYATNSAGTAYGEELTFTTNTQCFGGFDENGASNAVFTVASGRTVKFSRGNLQYTTTGSHATADGGTAVGTWRFAEHQYDFIGGADNHNISSTYRGWIDLFGWGTSGWSCQPWENENRTTYIYYYWPGGSYTNNLTGSYANADWGVYNAISNGGNQAGMWRTLTKDEWEYLLFSRAASTINGEANARYAKAVVNGTKGLVIFPDNFTMPSGMSNPSGINTSSAPFNNNTYTESEWSQMEGAGCIFLPAAGWRNFRVVSNVGACGNYWSSSHSDNHDGDYAWSMYFNSGTVGVNDDYRYYGQSVRLVRD